MIIQNKGKIIMKEKNKKCIVALSLLCSCFAICGVVNKSNKNENLLVNASNEKDISYYYDNCNYEENEVIVTFEKEFSNLCKQEGYELIKEELKNCRNLNLEGIELIGNYDNVQYLTVSIPLMISGKENVLKAIEEISKNKNIDFAGPNFIQTVEAVTMNDPDLSKQWSVNNTTSNIGILNAWNTTCGEKTVRVGIMDTGICIHEDLKSNIEKGYDFYNDNDVTDDAYYSAVDKKYDYHGTHVAGIVAAVGNNSKGICGIAPKVKVVPLQVSDGYRSINTHAQIDAINYAISVWGTDKQISVINHSISGFGTNVTILNAAKKFPGLFVWSAGNNNDDVDNFTHIEEFDCGNVISVGNVDKNLSRYSSSNYGYGVDVYAPGTEIWSTVGTNSYENKWGTSMSAPHVSAAAALLFSKYPNLTAGEVKKCLLDGAKTISIASEHGRYTTKYLNVENALKKAPLLASGSIAYLRLGIEDKVNSTWKVRIYNDNSKSVNVIYNKKMCNEGDARELTGLVHITDIVISSKSSKLVEISENVWAKYIVAAITDTSSGKRYISYANGLQKNGNVCILNPVQNNTKTFSLDFNSASTPPNYLSLSVVGCSTFLWMVYSWKIRISNRNSFPVYVSYNSKMCFEGDAETYDISDSCDSYISSNNYVDVTIVPNGTARFIVASLNYSYHGVDIRRITYAKDLSSDLKIGTNLHSCYYVLY